MDVVRVLRVIEYVGPRNDVERCVANSIQGQRTFGRVGAEVTIKAATIGTYPEILNSAVQEEETNGPE